MRAAVAHPDRIEFVELPDPQAGPEEVVIAVSSTAINRADLLQRHGLYRGPAVLPGGVSGDVPGLEFAGVVVALGSRCASAAIGDRVMGIVAGGAHATHVVVHERQLMPVPASIDLADAAAIPEVYLTAWDALVVQGGLTSGRTALIHAGASGVGTAAIQICRSIGARSIVTASAGKLDRCRELGATLAVERSPSDWLSAIRPSIADGVDVVLDVVGELARNLQAVRVGGRIVQVGVLGDADATVPLGLLLTRRAQLIGTVLRARPLEEKIATSRRFAAEVLPGFDRGVLAPVIDRHVAFTDIALAYEAVAANATVGKVVIDVG
jgi:putative PIG3 family NAD(P)H quinone oxidoreductase